MTYEFRRQDFYTGLILCVVSLGVVAQCWRMPRDLQGWPAYASPGVVTGLLGLGLFGMGLALTLRSVRRAGAPLGIAGVDVRAYLTDVGSRRLALMLGLSVIYCLLLGRNLPYWLTTGGYLLAVMFAFRAGPWWQLLLITAGSTAAVAYVFNRVFAIPLP
ncbi:MAG TPA: tripartite tricarboxylate transporter TctB family protein [Candidatus Methylomirabilis sp.]|nr:tripartite tricarboxylate transporter TctB family protein [Candidatus Methylomirabilis sp.]